MNSGEANILPPCSNHNFLIGVVEGFYGRPWSFPQRKELFKRMQRMGMNAYLYAPKDDLKHRQYWRELYSSEEVENMRALVESAGQYGVNFIYALSPGLDIIFSDPQELLCLKRKMDQVAELGCQSFALLFDDIEPNLSSADKALYPTAAHAQSAVSNAIYQHLNKPTLLFCPTEYCATRAVPSVLKSDYLNVIGTTLLPGIDVMWTGPKVISKVITPESIRELAGVLRRPPVIWDNLHANDYDQKRLFLGPYCGRPSELVSCLRGVMTNPNCEFEANFIPMYTLAVWSRCSRAIYGNEDPNNQDVETKLEDAEQGEDGVSSDSDLDPIEVENPAAAPQDTNVQLGYRPKQALRAALSHWREILYLNTRRESPTGEGRSSTGAPTTPSASTRVRRNQKKVAQALVATAAGSLPPSVASEAVAAATAQLIDVAHPGSGGPAHMVSLPNNGEVSVATALAVAAAVAEKVVSTGQEIALDPALLLMAPPDPSVHPVVEILRIPPPPPVPMEMETETEQEVEVGDREMQIDPQPNKTSTTGRSTSQENMMIIEPGEDDGPHEGTHQRPILTGTPSEDGQSEDEEFNHQRSHQSKLSQRQKDSRLTLSDLRLFVDLFYLPYEHGKWGLRLLRLFHWLRSNTQQQSTSLVQTTSRCEESDQDRSTAARTLWLRRANEFTGRVDKFRQLCDKFMRLPNREVVYDLYPYMSDTRVVLGMLNSYLRWMAECDPVPYPSAVHLHRLLTWYTPHYQEMFSGGDHESWMFRGGLVAEFQRMLPLEGSHDLFPTRPLGTLGANANNSVQMQPPSCVFLVRPYRNHVEGREALYALCPDGGDRLSAMLEARGCCCFVVENKKGVVCGYAVGVEMAPLTVPQQEEKDEQQHGMEDQMTTSMTENNKSPPPANIGTNTAAPPAPTNNPADHPLTCFPGLVDVGLGWISEAPLLTDEETRDELARRLFVCLFAALRTNSGMQGVRCELDGVHKERAPFYRKYGFQDMPATRGLAGGKETLILARLI